jgi:hypothetical protein
MTPPNRAQGWLGQGIPGRQGGVLMRRSRLIIAVWLWVASGALGAPVAGAQVPDAFGTVSRTVHVIGATEFDVPSNIATWAVVSLGGVGHLIKRSSETLLAVVRLPAGAVVVKVELQGCDSSNSVGIGFAFVRFSSHSDPGTLISSGGTGISQTPGCGLFPGSTFNPVVIDNETSTYVVVVNAPNVADIGVSGFRIYYTLQVSPAPATATFGDVPTSHPFFQFVEALVASGITVGCGGGNYCPDAPLTRGQMAVFLSKALGLHFAP